MSKTTLFLIRHGQTDWNLAGKMQGSTDIPLNETGREQAQKVAQLLIKKQASLTAIYSSDLQRAHQTAHEISQFFALEVILATELRERHLGKIEGLTKQEMYEVYGLSHYEALPEKIGAEPRDKVIFRSINYLHSIAEKHAGQHVAIVTHGGILGSLLTHLGHNLEELPAITNNSIMTFTWHADRKIFVFESIEHAT